MCSALWKIMEEDLDCVDVKYLTALETDSCQWVTDNYKWVHSTIHTQTNEYADMFLSVFLVEKASSVPYNQNVTT